MSKARVLHIVNEYPALSQTYIRSEIEALRPTYDIEVIHLRRAPQTYATDVPHRQIRRERRIASAIRSFRPMVLHTHFVMFAPLLDRLSAVTGRPFTVRSHSFDSFGYLRDKHADPGDGVTVAEVVDALNSPRCLGVLAFPFMRPYFIESGVRDDQVHDCFPVVQYTRFLDRSPNGNAIMNTGATLPKKKMEDCITLAKAVPEVQLNLYAMGVRSVAKLQRLSESTGARIAFKPPIQPDDMRKEYKLHRWLVYTASFERNTVGWPMSFAEAQAAGVGVCAPNLRPDIAEYLGGSGFLYDDIRDVAEIVRGPVPREVRDAGFEVSRRSDVGVHIKTLTDLW